MGWLSNKEISDEEKEILSMVEKVAQSQHKIDPGSFLAKLHQMVTAHEMEVKSLRRLIELMENPEVEEAMNIWLGEYTQNARTSK